MLNPEETAAAEEIALLFKLAGWPENALMSSGKFFNYKSTK